VRREKGEGRREKGEAMSIEFCPLCRTATNMIVTVSPGTIARKDGKMKTITFKTYHSESCGSFVKTLRTTNS
jgi:hypothetical protein